jgi:hypothetical protein
MNSVPLILLGKIHCINPFAVGSSKLSLPCIFYTHAVCFANLTLPDFITLIFGEKYKLWSLCSPLLGLHHPAQLPVFEQFQPVGYLLVFCFSGQGSGRRLARLPERGGTGTGTHPKYPQGGEQAVREMERPHRPLGPMAAEIRWQSCGKWSFRIDLQSPTKIDVDFWNPVRLLLLERNLNIAVLVMWCHAFCYKSTAVSEKRFVVILRVEGVLCLPKNWRNLFLSVVFLTDTEWCEQNLWSLLSHFQDNYR